MKMQLFRIAVVVGALLVASAALAQSGTGDILVNIPFPFVVENQHLPAGHYGVSRLANGVLRMFDTNDTRRQLFLNVHPVERPKQQEAKLVFHRYGDAYFLSEVWNGRGNIGKQLPTSKRERELASGKMPGTRTTGEIAQVRAQQ